MSDVLIIGGGVAGLSLAARLSARCAVTLLEAEQQLGYHASGRSAAVFLESYGNDTVRALNKLSKPWLERAGALAKRDFLLAGRANDTPLFEREMRSFGANRITVQEALAFFPILDTAAYSLIAHYDQAFDLDTDLVLQSLTREARANGARIETDQSVQEITGGGSSGRWQVHTNSDVFEATHLVNAAGAWADQIARLAGVRPLRIQPMRRSMARLPLPETMPATGRWAMVDGVGESWYAKPERSGLLVSPSEEHPIPAQDAYPDDMVLAEGLDRYAHAVTSPITRVLASWAGLRSFAPDRALVLGQDPNRAGFWWCAGQGGYGFQTAPAAAHLLSALITDSPPPLPEHICNALSPSRFA